MDQQNFPFINIDYLNCQYYSNAFAKPGNAETSINPWKYHAHEYNFSQKEVLKPGNMLRL